MDESSLFHIYFKMYPIERNKTLRVYYYRIKRYLGFYIFFLRDKTNVFRYVS